MGGGARAETPLQERHGHGRDAAWKKSRSEMLRLENKINVYMFANRGRSEPVRREVVVVVVVGVVFLCH